MRLPPVFALAAMSVAFFAACSPTVANRGYLLDPEKVAAIKPGVSNRDSVINTLGSPSLHASFDENTWYYVSRQTEQYAFLDPQVLDQQVLTVTFDDDGIVKTVSQTGKDKIADIDSAAGRTATYGHETTWIQDLFGNIGRAGVPISRQQR